MPDVPGTSRYVRTAGYALTSPSTGGAASATGPGCAPNAVDDIDRDEWDGMSDPARFNAKEDWAKVDALYFEYETMRDAGCASYAALRSAYEAVRRAVEDAGALAPWWLVEPPEDASGAA